MEIAVVRAQQVLHRALERDAAPLVRRVLADRPAVRKRGHVRERDRRHVRRWIDALLHLAQMGGFERGERPLAELTGECEQRGRAQDQRQRGGESQTHSSFTRFSR